MILDQAYTELEVEIPSWLAKAIKRMRSPSAKWIRLPVALLLIAASFFWFLPIVGIEMLPIGVLLLAEDVPVLRTPVGKAILWLIHKWRALKGWWQVKRR